MDAKMRHLNLDLASKGYFGRLFSEVSTALTMEGPTLYTTAKKEELMMVAWVQPKTRIMRIPGWPYRHPMLP